MKSILLSIKPKWVAKILNGDKIIEIRKQFPKDFKGWVYIYCTKEDRDILSPMMLNNSKKGFAIYSKLIKGWHKYSPSEGKYNCSRCFADIDNLNGKVVARFYCGKVEEIKPKILMTLLDVFNTYETKTSAIKLLLKECCLSYEELDSYLKRKNGYAIHISNLEIFDEPKELLEFKTYKTYNIGDMYNCRLSLTKAPQNYCYIEIEKK